MGNHTGAKQASFHRKNINKAIIFIGLFEMDGFAWGGKFSPDRQELPVGCVLDWNLAA